MRQRSYSSFIIPTNLPKSDFVTLAKSEGEFCQTYTQLRQKIAQLACGNPDSLLFFRGQKEDYSDPTYKNIGSSFFPSIYRGNCPTYELEKRWAKLKKACDLLKDKLDQKIKSLDGKSTQKDELRQVIQRRLLQWAIIQHYEITDTPLLDVSQSLRVACSFATMGSQEPYAYIYAFAIPYFTGRISVNSEHMLTNIRLLSIAPSLSLRPHFQEGFLLGEEDLEEKDQKSQNYDFRRRLVGKFKIPNSDQFWQDDNNAAAHERALTQEELYPEADEFITLSREVKEKLEAIIIDDNALKKDPTGYFLSLWGKLESISRDIMGAEGYNNKSVVMQAIRKLNAPHLRNDLQKVSQFRNQLVHTGFSPTSLSEMIFSLESSLKKLEEILNE